MAKDLPNETAPLASTASAGLAEVTHDELERQLQAVTASAANPTAGLFGPDSVTWRIDRESATFLAAGRAMLLQLSHPWVAAAITRHSHTLSDPIGRFHRTFSIMFTIVFGTAAQAAAAARALHRRHASIRGKMAETAGRFAKDSDYFANHVPALRWVHATLIDSAALANDLLLPALTPSELDRFTIESHRLAGMFGIPDEELPRDWNAFKSYFDEMVESDALVVTGAARSLAQHLLSGTGLPLPIPGAYRALTAQLLPPRLRQDYGLPYGEKEVAAATRVIARMRWVYALLPAHLRFVGPYLEARSRLRGRPPALPVRLSNRLWIGRPSL